MKFSWGTGIFIFLMVFVSLCGVFIWFAFSKDVNLVNDEYYQKGVNHTEQMKIEKYSEIYRNQIYFENAADSISIFFPDIFLENSDTCKIVFFRPSDRYLDKLYNLVPQTNKLKISKSGLILGRYLVQFSWISKNKNFYLEKEYFVK